MSEEKLIPQKKETYIALIENSEGSKTFNSAFVRNKETGEIYDVLNYGEYSCAFFVSGILTLVGLIDRPHATVRTVGKKLLENGFEVVSEAEAGDILVWEEIVFENGSKNEHIGFYLDDNTAISTSWTEKMVIKHHPTFGIEKNGSPKRQIVSIFRYHF